MEHFERWNGAMTQNHSMNIDRKPLIWVIYQGEEGARCVKDVFRPEEKKLGCELRFTVDHEPGVFWSVLNRVHQDCEECDAAIALVTPDDRVASVAGNAWFEIGLWLGSRDQHLIKVLQHEKTTLASDLSSSIVRTFANDEQLRTAFVEQIYYLKDRLSPTSTENNGKEKIHAIFGNEKKPCWLKPESYACHRELNSTEPCQFRERSMEFTAELLRMGRSNHERHTIEDSLSRVVYYGKGLLFLYNNENFLHTRKETTDKFVKAVSDLHTHIDEVFNTPGRKSYTLQHDTHKRFRLFLKQKLECIRDLIEKIQDTPFESKGDNKNENNTSLELVSFDIEDIEDLKDRLDDAWDWLESFQRSQFRGALKKVKWGGGFLYQFIEYIDYWCDVAFVLQALNQHYFKACRKVLSVCSASDGDPRKVHKKFQTAIKKLPHNKSGPHLRIWREEAS